MTRKQIEVLDRKTWSCPGCQEIEANPHQQAMNDPEEESEVKIRKTKISNLKMLQINIDFLLSKLEELKMILKKEDIEIILVQETKAVKKDKINIPGFTLCRKDRTQLIGNEENRGGGLLIGIRKDIPYKDVYEKVTADLDKHTEWNAVEIPMTSHHKLRLTNIYIPPDNTRCIDNEDAITTENWPCKGNDIVLGDFNAHSSLWDDNTKNGISDRRARKIEDWLAETGMASLNTGEATHVSRSTGTLSAPDITFAHSSMMDKLSWKTLNVLGSDHKPILITYEDEMIRVNNKPKYKWKLGKADWENYSQDVEDSIPTTFDKSSITKLEKKLRKAMTNSANKNIGKKKITMKSKPWMTSEIKEAITKRNELRKTVAQNREEWIDACKKTSELVKERKQQTWKEHVQSITATTSSKKVWQTIRAMDGRRPPGRENEVLEVAGTTYVEDADKAEQFAKTYRSFSKLPVAKEDRVLRRYNRKHMKRKHGPVQESEQPLTWTELERVIDEAKNNKAAGEDDIPYELIKNLGPKAKELLLHIYNRCWEGEGIPPKWRTAIIKPLLKDGKDPKQTASYRPISLTSCLGKLLEKIIGDRLVHVLEQRGLLNDNQAGFRPGRCTTDQILKLVQQATDQMHASPGNTRTITTFFDYEKAYDKVWRDGLIHKMLKMNLPGRFVNYTRHFLSGRKTTVEVNGTKSKSFRLNQGLPQGSSISPILFLIFINDIDVDLDIETIASLFADDTAIWMKDGKIRGSNRILMQEEIDKIMAWAKRWKMKVNEDKTKGMVISSSTGDNSWDPQLNAGEQRVEFTQDYKFLGITIDNSLRFTKHVSNITTKCRKRVNIIKCLSTKDWGCNLETQRALYLTYIRLVLEYSSSGWTPWLSETQLTTLQRVQNSALRSVANLYQSCPEDFLHLETGVPPLRDRYQQNDDITWDRYAQLPESDQRRQLQLFEGRTRLKTRIGWRKKAGDRMKNLNITRETTSPHLPPWISLDRLTLDKVLLDRPKAEYTSEELKELSMAKIRSFTTEVTIYTDGSTDELQERGGAGVFIEDAMGLPMLEASFPAGKLCSSYTGECVAMLRALEWLQERRLSSLVCTDSLSLHSALSQNDFRDRDPWLKEVKKMLLTTPEEVTLLWIPSHCDVPGNERADALAKEGSELNQENTPVTHQIVKSKIKARKWAISHKRAIDTYGNRRKPNFKIERKWPKDVRTLFSRLRTGHCLELKSYQHRLDATKDARCMECHQEEETIEHILCNCPAEDARRQQLKPDGNFTTGDLISKPELCRQLLERRFQQLKLPDEED